MLTVTIPATETYSDKFGFVTIPETTIQLEHSLISVSKWESKWHKAFMSKEPKTFEESQDYIRCMTITQNVKPEVYMFIPNDVYAQINKYIEDPMTATTFTDRNRRPQRSQVITSEVIYWQMIECGIPFECQKWHLNRLMALIRVCAVKNGGSKKMSKKDMLAQNRILNAQRRAKFGSGG